VADDDAKPERVVEVDLAVMGESVVDGLTATVEERALEETVVEFVKTEDLGVEARCQYQGQQWHSNGTGKGYTVR